jgi:SAM-dependent methyltransferase
MAPGAEQAELASIAEFYDRATADYQHWSAALHMHFGLWRWPLSPFDRAGMLDALSRFTHERLGLDGDAEGDADGDAEGTVVDLGCGVGSSARLLARAHPRSRVLGLSLSATQVELGNRLSVAAGLRERVEMRLGDYRSTSLAGASAVGAYAIESACYDFEGGAGLIREAARVLRPGARLVVADAFLRRADLPRPARIAARFMAEGWALTSFNERDGFIAHLDELGFEVESVEDLSLRVLPSLLQIPWVTLRFRLREGFGLGARREGNACAALWCLIAPLLWPRCFGYFVITARRR